MKNISIHVDAKFNTCSRTVTMFQSGNIILSNFAAIQLIHGAQIYFKSEEFVNKVSPEFKIMQLELYVQLTQCIMPKKMDDSSIIELSVTHFDFDFMRLFLEARIAHCEKERDNKSENFDIETHIEQKLLLLLLLDIREKQTCIIIE